MFTPNPSARPGLVLILLAVSLVLTACSFPNSTATKAAATASGNMSQGEILQVVRTLNDGELKQARLAMERSDKSEIREPAQLIIRDHQASNRRIDQVVESGVELQETTLSQGMKMQADEVHEELQQLSGTEFECTYLQKQVELHGIALTTVREDLLPEAQERASRDILITAAPALEQHQKVAQQQLNKLDCP